MQIILDFVSNIGVMVLSIVALLGFGWFVLLILHWGMKFKSGSREEEGLVQLWESALTQQNKDAKQTRSGDKQRPGAPPG